MKAISLVVLILVATIFSACERNDYQHPGYRSGKHK